MTWKAERPQIEGTLQSQVARPERFEEDGAQDDVVNRERETHRQGRHWQPFFGRCACGNLVVAGNFRAPQTSTSLFPRNNRGHCGAF